MNNPKVLTGAAVATLGVLWFTPGNPFNTPAVQNVGDRWAAAGGTHTHTPGMSTPRENLGFDVCTEPVSPGNSSDNEAPHEMKGVGTKHFDENFADQKVDYSPNPIHKAWNQAQYGNDKGK